MFEEAIAQIGVCDGGNWEFMADKRRVEVRMRVEEKAEIRGSRDMKVECGDDGECLEGQVDLSGGCPASPTVCASDEAEMTREVQSG